MKIFTLKNLLFILFATTVVVFRVATATVVAAFATVTTSAATTATTAIATTASTAVIGGTTRVYATAVMALIITIGWTTMIPTITASTAMAAAVVTITAVITLVHSCTFRGHVFFRNRNNNVCGIH